MENTCCCKRTQHFISRLPSLDATNFRNLLCISFYVCGMVDMMYFNIDGVRRAHDAVVKTSHNLKIGSILSFCICVLLPLLCLSLSLFHSVCLHLVCGCFSCKQKFTLNILSLSFSFSCYFYLFSVCVSYFSNDFFSAQYSK